MSEISSPKLLEIKVDKTGINNIGINRVLTNKETIPEKESPIRFTNTDMYNSSQKNTALFSQNTLNQSPTFLLMSSIYSKITNPFIKAQDKMDVNKQAIFDITDKLAAIYGEKEKDIKDKLSDVFKKLILRPFNLVSEVDTSMEQQDHHKEKKLKDREPENKNFEIKTNNKEFSFRQWINYKLLEITGEILNLSRKFTAGIKEKNKKIYNGFKKIKGKINFFFTTIDSYLEPPEKITKEPEINNVFKE